MKISTKKLMHSRLRRVGSTPPVLDNHPARGVLDTGWY